MCLRFFGFWILVSVGAVAASSNGSGHRVHGYSLLRGEGMTVDCMRVSSGPSGCGFGFGVLISLSFAVIIPGPLAVREAGRLIGECFYPTSIF